MRKRILVFLAVFQSILFLTHWFVYQTWMAFRSVPDPPGIPSLAVVFSLLSVTFLTASLLARRYSHLLVRLYYKASAVWLGFLSFFFLAACCCWILYAIVRLLGLRWEQQSIAFALFGAAVLVSVYGLLNSARVRVKRITVRLPNLPDGWRGRVAALVTDMHLGHVRGYRFARRIVTMLSRARPDVVLIGGDLYDGTAADVRRLAEPLGELSAPLGTYFIAGNHEEFAGRRKYLEAVKNVGVRVLCNEKVVVDGLQIVGVHHRDSVDPQHFRSILRQADLDPNRASLLLTHAPNQLTIAAEERVGLQLSGHTHGGQFVPFTWITSRIYGRFVYGLKSLGDLIVYTSCGAGTWGPPMRVGTRPEIVLIGFE
jgi:predicted MPP superfamily phosphohydrolase